MVPVPESEPWGRGAAYGTGEVRWVFSRGRGPSAAIQHNQEAKPARTAALREDTRGPGRLLRDQRGAFCSEIIDLDEFELKTCRSL